MVTYSVIIKYGNALECMRKVDAITFDKTGTLIKGDLNVVDKTMNRDRLLLLAAFIEVYLEHPLVKANSIRFSTNAY